ncbi:MAG: hypothetical protein CM15mP80_02730 [Alphaproteobacteria bacterium]|nr:MAG: hypothetical protein CM15mP80_02730 [Alphaproteobacteria bacterium]
MTKQFLMKSLLQQRLNSWPPFSLKPQIPLKFFPPFWKVLEGKRVKNCYLLRHPFGNNNPDLDVPSYAQVVSGSAFSSQSVFTSKIWGFEKNVFSVSTVENTTVTPTALRLKFLGGMCFLERGGSWTY